METRNSPCGEGLGMKTDQTRFEPEKNIAQVLLDQSKNLSTVLNRILTVLIPNLHAPNLDFPLPLAARFSRKSLLSRRDLSSCRGRDLCASIRLNRYGAFS